MPRRSVQRPRISAPLGPVKTSRGPDLVRSEILELVESIKDCESGTSTRHISSIASRRSRRISASFLSSAAPSTSPIVAKSDVEAVTHIESTKTSKSPFARRPALLSLTAKSLLKQPSKYTLVTQASSIEDGENVAPLKVKDQQGANSISPQKIGSRLPKSKTMMVLHGLKKSFSRPSLAAVKNSGFENKMTITPRKTPSLPQSHSVMTIPDTCSSSSTTPTATPEASHSPCSSTPRTDVKYIDAAQPSEYWSGRYMSLQDRLLSENLTDESLELYSSRVDNHWQEPKSAALGRHSLNSSCNRLTYLAPSNTTSALTTIAYNPKRRLGDQDDIRRRRIFTYLYSLCSTVEARKSLRAWQQSYAHRIGCQEVLPLEDCMGVKERETILLGSVNSRFKNGDRRSPALKELPTPRIGAFGIKLASSRGVAVC